MSAQTAPTRRRARSRRPLILGAAFLAIVAGSVVGYSALASNNGGSSRQQTLDTHLVSFSSFEVTTTTSGELEAKNQIEVRSELENSSTIVEVVDEGKVVKKGDVLVRLNSDEVQTQITDVELRVESSKADLEKAETACKIQEKENASKISQARLKVLLAELAYKQWDEGEKVQKTKDHDQAITKAQEEKVRLEEKYLKCVALQEKGFVSTDQMKRDKLEFDDAVRALEKATLARDIFDKYEIPKDRATKQSDVDQAKEELERVEEQGKIELRSKESERVTSQRKLDTNVEHLAKLKRQLEKSTILAPADGLVVYATSMERSRRGWGDDGPLSIGRQVHPNEALIILPDTSEMVATVRVHETLASRVREGLPATVKVDAIGGRTFNAKVLSVGILAEASGWRDPNLREYTVKLALTNPERVELKPSMRCEAVIVMGQVDNALSLPIQAVHNDGMLRYVYVQSEPGSVKYVRRPVRLGRISESLGEVAVGLKDGERVLLRKPSPGEVLDRDFPEAELLAVGLKKDATTGQLVMADGSRGGPGNARAGAANGNRRAGGPGAGGPAGGNGQGNRRPGNDAVANKGGAEKPAASDDAKPAAGADSDTKKSETAPASEASAAAASPTTDTAAAPAKQQ